ncbi:hypothetical protein KY329_04770 [Candidatus Woesearchaeota archaeon]|nr:hypothetical protein [Candidatus Woesearchaeota archaeon]
MDNKTYSVTTPPTEAQIECAVRACIEDTKTGKIRKDGKIVCTNLKPKDLENELNCVHVYVEDNSEGEPTCYCGAHKFKPNSNGQYR